jgi:GDPmannose 4,6-dehydratase
MTALIFGANGQDGYYLSRLLTEKNVEVTGVSRTGNYIYIDIRDFQAVKELISKIQPDYIFHFAANSSTRHDLLFENHSTISTGTLNILEAVKTSSQHSKVFISGSGLQFRNMGSPIKETDPFEARDAYSVARIHSVYAARYYRTLGVKTYVGYFFNHDSPRRTERHVSQMIAAAVRNIAKGDRKEPIEIGDIEVKKEWTFAGDTVKAVWTLIQQDAVFEATIGSGKAYSIADYLEACFSSFNRNWKDYLKIKPGFKPEYSQLVSDPATIFSLGWKQEVDFLQLVQMMLTE